MPLPEIRRARALEDPVQNWKFSSADLAEGAYWDEHQRGDAFHEVALTSPRVRGSTLDALKKAKAQLLAKA